MQSYSRFVFPHPTVARAAWPAAVAAAASGERPAGPLDQQLPTPSVAARRQPLFCTQPGICDRRRCCCCATLLTLCSGTRSHYRRSGTTPSCCGCPCHSTCDGSLTQRSLRHSRSGGSTSCRPFSTWREKCCCALETSNRRRSGSSTDNKASANPFSSSSKGSTARCEGLSCGVGTRLINASHTTSHTISGGGGGSSHSSRTGVDNVFSSRSVCEGRKASSKGRPARWENCMQSCITRRLEGGTRDRRRPDWCPTAVKRRMLAVCPEKDKASASARPRHRTGGDRRIAGVHSRIPADECVTPTAAAVVSRAALNGAVPNVGSGHAGLHTSASLPGDGGLMSFFAPERWASFKSNAEGVQAGTPVEGTHSFGRRGAPGAAVSHAYATLRAAPTAQRLRARSTKGAVAACAATGVATPVPEAAAGAGGGGVSERRRRAPAQDGAVDLAAEVGRAVEGLRSLQQQRRQRQQLEMQQRQQPQQQQEQQPLYGDPDGDVRASFQPNRLWRQPGLKDEDFVCLKKRWVALLERLRPLGHISTANSVKLYDDGDKAFTAMLHEIDRAQRDVLLETYMFDASLLACRVKNALCEAAQRGCFVVLIVDWVGSINMPFAWKKELLASGVRLLIFNPPLFLPVFSGSSSWPQGPTVQPDQNVWSPVFQVFKYFFASHRQTASPQSSLALSTSPDSGGPSGNSTGRGSDINGGGNSGESGSEKNSDSRLDMQEPMPHVDHSRGTGKAVQDALGGVSLQSEADKEESRREERSTGVLGLATLLRGVAESSQADEKKITESIPTTCAPVRGRAPPADEEDGRTTITDAHGEAPSGGPASQAAYQSSKALHGGVKENEAITIASEDVPKRLLWANKIGPVPFRDHRKLLLVDGSTAFIGSLNVSEDGVGKKYGGRGFFYDLHARLRGPVVRHMQQLVIETIEISRAFDLAEQLRHHMATTACLQGHAPLSVEMQPPSTPRLQLQREKQRWPWLLGGRWRSDLLEGYSSRAGAFHSRHFIVSEGEDGEDRSETDEDDAEDVLIQVLKSNVLHNERSIQAALQAAISNASKSVCVTSSYFIPPGFLRRALHAALSRGGVDVSLLLSGNSDVWGDVYATIYVIRKFLTKNCRRHSFFSAGWEKGALKENNIVTDLTAYFSSGSTQKRSLPTSPASGDVSGQAVAPPRREAARTAQVTSEEQAADVTRETNANAAAPAGTERSESTAAVGMAAAPRTATAAEVAAAEAGETTSGPTGARSAGSRALPAGEGREASEESQGRPGVYFLLEHHCHAKNIVVDHLWSSLGSFNFDRFSSRRNLEVLVTFFDPQIAYKFETLHWKRISEEAEQMTVEKWNHQPFIKKLLCSCCYYLTRFAGKNFFDGLSDQRSRAILKRLLIASYLDDMPAADIFLGMAWGVH